MMGLEMGKKEFTTRMHEVLGVEPDKEYTFENGVTQFNFYVDTKGHAFIADKSEGDYLCAYYLTKLINNPERITRRPRLTEEQILALNAAVKWFGFKWLVKDKCESVCFWQNKPEKRENHWSAYGGGMYSDIMTVKVDNLVSWSDPEPLDIVQTLRDAGVEVE